MLVRIIRARFSCHGGVFCLLVLLPSFTHFPLASLMPRQTRCGRIIVFEFEYYGSNFNNRIENKCTNNDSFFSLFSRWGGCIARCTMILDVLIWFLRLCKQQPDLNIITEYIIGYAYPGRPVANMCFKVYGYISMYPALTFLAEF